MSRASPNPQVVRRFPLRHIHLALVAAGASLAFQFAAAQLVAGPDWVVAYSLPSQTDDSSLEGEFAIRDLLLRHIDRLSAGDHAALATFTLSGDSMESGAAGPILNSISAALDRGAAFHFVADGKIKRTKEFAPGLSLYSLARRQNNPMALSVAPWGVLMHHKAAIFDYGEGDQWSFVGSGNFTGAANSRQWNIALLIRNAELHQAFAAEMAEFRAKRFSQHKRFDHDRTNFRLQDSWGTCWVRFGPYPGATAATPHAETDILRLIASAEEEIVFAMHRFNRPPLRRALVAAANRGIRVTGVIPLSDRGNSPFAVSRKTADYLANPAHYTGTNRVHLLPVRASAIDSSPDSGQPDLVHMKYALIDPNGRRPFVIHGAANWTVSGLISPDANDESILFLRHAGIAQAFLEQFQRMTGLPPTASSTTHDSSHLTESTVETPDPVLQPTD
jgi:phosphatidylserine/phosphatidylglycerophosphate/cardiolipin synthase-like enzyme